jgi:transposase
LPDRIGAHVRAFEFFGGASALIVSDNLKSAVMRACFHELRVNRSYTKTACAGASSDTRRSPCPPVFEYTRTEQARVADKVEALPVGVLIAERLAADTVLHTQTQACTRQ